MNDYTLSKLHEIYLTQGSVSAEYSVELSEEKVDTYCALFDHVSPLHTDDAFAKSLGWTQRIVPQLLIVSFALPMVEEYLPGKYGLGLGSSDLAFRNPVYVGDVLLYHGEITKISMAAKMIIIDMVVTNQNGDIIMTCKWKAKVLK